CSAMEPSPTGDFSLKSQAQSPRANTPRPVNQIKSCAMATKDIGPSELRQTAVALHRVGLLHAGAAGTAYPMPSVHLPPIEALDQPARALVESILQCGAGQYALRLFRDRPPLRPRLRPLRIQPLPRMAFGSSELSVYRLVHVATRPRSRARRDRPTCRIPYHLGDADLRSAIGGRIGMIDGVGRGSVDDDGAVTRADPIAAGFEQQGAAA